MLPLFVIHELRKREEEKRNRNQPIGLELELPMPERRPPTDRPERHEDESYAVVIQL